VPEDLSADAVQFDPRFDELLCHFDDLDVEQRTDRFCKLGVSCRHRCAQTAKFFLHQHRVREMVVVNALVDAQLVQPVGLGGGQIHRTVCIVNAIAEQRLYDKAAAFQTAGVERQHQIECPEVGRWQSEGRIDLALEAYGGAEAAGVGPVSRQGFEAVVGRDPSERRFTDYFNRPFDFISRSDSSYWLLAEPTERTHSQKRDSPESKL
jgi:hypothetical protein